MYRICFKARYYFYGISQFINDNNDDFIFLWICDIIFILLLVLLLFLLLLKFYDISPYFKYTLLIASTNDKF